MMVALGGGVVLKSSVPAPTFWNWRNCKELASKGRERWATIQELLLVRSTEVLKL
jgi:hypothetical protein